MAYASPYLPERDGPRLRLGPTLAGLVCGVAAPSLVAAVIFSFAEDALSFRDVFSTAAGFAMLGLMSILTMFLPMILWRLPYATSPLSTCVVLGAISGPGPLGYLFAIGAPLFVTRPCAMGAFGGLVFWFVAVRGKSQRTG